MSTSYRETIAGFLGRPGLDRSERHLCWISIFVSLGEMDGLRDSLVAALGDDLAPEAIREAILQNYLFVGYPRVINALVLLKAVCEERGSAFPAAVAAEEDYSDWRRWEERGEKLCRTIYGDRYDRLRQRIGELHPLLARWMVVEGYGKVLAREGLPGQVREKIVISVLASQGVWRQLRSHILGAYRLGITEEEIRAIIVQSAPFLPVDRVRSALRILDESPAREVAD